MKDFCWIALVILAACATHGHAAGLGAIAVQSGLGEPLRVNIALVGADAFDDGSQCVNAKVSSLDGGTPISAKASVIRSAQSAAVQLTTHQNLNELAVNISVSIGCTATVHRDYQVLLDPVVALPATRDASLLPPAAQADANTFAPSKRHLLGNHEDGHEPRRDANSALAPMPLKKAERISRPRTKRSWHDVFTVSSVDEETGTHEMDRQHATLNLKLATTLSAPTTETDPNKLADIRAQQARLAPHLRDDDPEKIAELRMKPIQDEIQALRAENGRSKQQDASNQAELQATRNELRRWVGGLGASLLVCFGAIGWLLWRLFIDKKNDVYASWNRIIGNHGTDAGDLGYVGDAVKTGYLPTVDDALWPAASVDLPHGDQKAPEPQYTAEGLIPSVLVKDSELHHSRGLSEHRLNAEEVSDITELAEVWMAIHQDPMKLLELLEPFNDVERPDSPLPWLCLLDVYRSIGDSQKYEATRRRIKKIFNVKLAPWDAEPDTAHIRTLSDFPHVTEKILDLWESQEIAPYLRQLLNDQRDGTRDGFDLPVYSTIMQLVKLASAPDPSKQHNQKAYAILTGANKHQPEGAPGNSASDAAQAESAVGKTGEARAARDPTSGNSERAKGHPSVARGGTAVREWLAEESIALPANPARSNATATPGKIPVASKLSFQAVNELDGTPQHAPDWVPMTLLSNRVSGKLTCLSAATLDQLTPEKVLKTGFPHIWQRICVFAIEPMHLRKYLLSLSMQDRAEKRAGFPLEALKEIADIQIQNDCFVVEAAHSWQAGFVHP